MLGSSSSDAQNRRTAEKSRLDAARFRLGAARMTNQHGWLDATSFRRGRPAASPPWRSRARRQL